MNLPVLMLLGLCDTAGHRVFRNRQRRVVIQPPAKGEAGEAPRRMDV